MKRQWILSNEDGEKLRELQSRISCMVSLGLENQNDARDALLQIEKLSSEMEDILSDE